MHNEKVSASVWDDLNDDVEFFFFLSKQESELWSDLSGGSRTTFTHKPEFIYFGNLCQQSFPEPDFVAFVP